MVQRTRHVLLTMHLAVCAVVGVLPQFAALIDGQAAAAVEGLVGTHNAGIQPCRCGDELEHRAGHIQLSDVLILPLCLAHHTLQLGVLAGDLVAVLIYSLFAADFSIRHNGRHSLLAKAALEPVNIVGVDFLLIQNVGYFGVGDFIGVIGVKLLNRGHSQNGTGLDVHHNGASAAVHREGVHSLGQILLHNGLHVFVNRQVQVIAVNGLMHIGLPCGQRVAVDIRLRHTAARRAGQRLIVVFFQSVGTRAVTVAKSQHRGQELAVGVAAGRGLLG